MKVLFIGNGPAFKRGLAFNESFDNVNIYGIICHLLNITCPKSDGDLNSVKFLFA